jgi:hypothetical protein
MKLTGEINLQNRYGRKKPRNAIAKTHFQSSLTSPNRTTGKKIRERTGLTRMGPPRVE